MRAASLYAPKDIRCEDVPKPSIGEEEVLIKVMACGICGSDIPRVMEKGTYTFPTIPGHEIAGVAEETGGRVRNVKKGDRVAVIPIIPCNQCQFCKRCEYFYCKNYNYLGSRTDGGFAEYVKAPARNLVLMPDGISYEEGAFTEPLSVALHAVSSAKTQLTGRNAAVFGAGPIGNLIGQVANLYGAKKLFLIDIRDEKLCIAREVGLKDNINAKKDNPVNKIFDETAGEGVDVVFEVSGSAIAIKQGLSLIRPKGEMVLVGRIVSDLILEEKYWEIVLRKEITLKGIWGFEFAAFPPPSWNIVLRYMQEGKVSVKPLITHRCHLSEIKAVFKMMYEGKEFFNKVVVFPWEQG